MRKLASIQKIVSISPIDGADKIECAKILGWNLVVKRGEFTPGDLCMFFEPDAILPEAPWSEFMRSRNFRIKAVKMRGVLSQGLALPVLEECKNLSEGSDITDLLGVKKYDPPEVSAGSFGQSCGPFPALVPKTDEPRIQSSPDLLDALKHRFYVMTVKLDGTSFTATYDADQFKVCSRNLSLKNTEDSIFWKVAKKYNLEQSLRGTTYAVQGELCGPGIQKNRLKLKDHDLFIFNVYDWKAGRYLSPMESSVFCREVGLKTVPIEEAGLAFTYSQEELLEKAKGFYDNTDNIREGLVVRSFEVPRVSFKVINNDFLLKEE
jgi:RNA ligase (TIGR02306 family)